MNTPSCNVHPHQPAAFRCDNCYGLHCQECANAANGRCFSCGKPLTPMGGPRPSVAGAHGGAGAPGFGPSQPYQQQGFQGGYPPGPPPGPGGGYQGGYDPNARPMPNQGEAAGEEAGSRSYGWLWFILIYGVGNLILYKTTGILLLPIPRK